MALTLLVVLLAIVWIWADQGAPALKGEFLQSFDNAVEDGRFVLWIHRPSNVVARLEGFLSATSTLDLSLAENETDLASGPGFDSGALPETVKKVLPKVEELLVELDPKQHVAVDARVSSGWVILAKAVGLLTSNPWLSGGRVAVDQGSDKEIKGAVRWRKAGSFVANRWHLGQTGFQPATRAAGSKEGRGEPAVPILNRDVLVSGGGGNGGGAVWALLPNARDGLLRFEKVDRSSGQSEGHSEGHSESEQREHREQRKQREQIEEGGESLWWSSRESVSPRSLTDLGFEVEDSTPVLVAFQRSVMGWQALVWLDSPVTVEGRSVRLEVPRAAVLVADFGSDAEPWRLPAEKAAVRIGAAVEMASSAEGKSIRSFSSDATSVVMKNEKLVSLWVQRLPPGGTGLWLDPARLPVWFEAVLRLQSTLPGIGTASSDSDAALLRFARSFSSSTPLGSRLEEQGPIFIQYSPEALVLAAPGASPN